MPWIETAYIEYYWSFEEIKEKPRGIRKEKEGEWVENWSYS